jgi:hypothetical protein
MTQTLNYNKGLLVRNLSLQSGNVWSGCTIINYCVKINACALISGHIQGWCDACENRPGGCQHNPAPCMSYGKYPDLGEPEREGQNFLVSLH